MRRRFVLLALLPIALLACGPSEEPPAPTQQPAREAPKVPPAGPTADRTAQPAAGDTAPAPTTDRPDAPVATAAESQATETITIIKGTKGVEQVTVNAGGTGAATEPAQPDPVADVIAASQAGAARPPVEIILLKASYGEVRFTHAEHATTLPCATCHPGSTPGPFDLTKEVAHQLCKGCHKDQGSGPTGCKDCHIK